MTEWDLAYMRREVKPAPAAPLSDADIDRIADDVPVDQIGVHITTWHRRFARALLSAAPAVREPLIDEMDAVASKCAHKLALDLECVLSDYNGKWWDTAMQTIGEYRMAMNAIHERESPTHMGEPVLPKHGIGGGGK